ncbi:8862_t:CDS:2 [Diversispora eburnea]|uniref:8862_t:CDS:1 n=1 Tax=Diversispora eburnea TaxID=1213867 RepID=A0A9N9C247_9GLOM|nr:8862_t:CDS:2 [Diversispora eburnea]
MTTENYSSSPKEPLSPTSTAEKDSLSFDSCIAISPDSKQIVTFCPEKSEFKLYNTSNLSSNKSIPTPENIVNNEHVCWSIAISNCIDDGGNERLIALSCFDAKKLRRNENDENVLDKVNRQYVDAESGGDNQSSGNEIEIKCSPQTWVISTADGNKKNTSLESIGGVIRFLESNGGDNGGNSDQKKTVIIMVNASGIYKETRDHIKNAHGGKIKKLFSQTFKVQQFEQFELPQQLSVRLSRDHWQNSFELLHASINKNHFMVHSFKNRQQIIEMYSLITGDLEMLFKRHESSVAPNIIRGSPIFTISQNEKILAFCRGTTSITLYSMDNGLEIATKQLEGQRGIYKITAINFIDDDNKLLIVLDEKEYLRVEILKRQIFVVWDLFTTFENSIRQIDYSETTKPLKMDVTHRLMNSHGKMFAFRDSGDIISVLDHKDLVLIRNPPKKVITKIESEKLETDDNTKSDHDYHVIYSIDGEICDTEKNLIIINNVEPWHPNKNYFRISVFLDFARRTQLIISQNTIQVWKIRSNNIIGKRDKHDRVLEYIWARKSEIKVLELRIGVREFVLKVSMPSTNSSISKTTTIHWPNNVNVLEGSCRALHVLEGKKRFIASFENVNQIEYLEECIQGLVRKHIKKYGIFRLSSVRYPIMKYLIKSSQETLIRHILNTKINKKNSNIYIPRSYKWVDKSTAEITKPGYKWVDEISKSDLHHAILCQKRGDSTVILKYLIDYYADNAKEYNNYGWLFTVSKAIILLYDHQLNELVRYLFKKPCFGITEAYTPQLRLYPYDQKEENNTLSILKERFTRTGASNNDRKVYIVPLPDFTVYPNPKDLDPKGPESRDPEPNGPEYPIENYSKYFWFLFTLFRISLWPRRKVIKKTKKMSPFLRVIHEEKGYEVYQTPTIMAVLDFKWSAARRYFIRHIVMYIFYAISFGITVFPYSNKGKSNAILKIGLFVYSYTGWYLIVTEIVHLKREGLYRYINIYSIFDLGSLLLPPLASIASTLYNDQVFIFQKSVYNSILAFTALVMWLQLNVDKSSRQYSHFISSIEAVFFWTNGRWNQLDEWDSYSVELISILGSIILVLIFQNMLIAFMNAAFDKANEAGHAVAYTYRAELVAEYEALEKPFDSKKDSSNNMDPYGILSLQKKATINTLDSIDSQSGIIDRISFIDEEIFQFKVTSSKLNKKSLRNWESNKNKPLSDEPGPTANVDDQSSLQVKFNIMENEFKDFKTKFDELDQNLKELLKNLNNLNNSK